MRANRAASRFCRQEVTMDTKILGPKGSGRNDVLYAMLLIAGISATIFSVVGIAMLG